jgi:hypothetical protein
LAGSLALMGSAALAPEPWTKQASETKIAIQTDMLFLDLS